MTPPIPLSGSMIPRLLCCCVCKTTPLPDSRSSQKHMVMRVLGVSFKSKDRVSDVSRTIHFNFDTFASDVNVHSSSLYLDGSCPSGACKSELEYNEVDVVSDKRMRMITRDI